MDDPYDWKNHKSTPTDVAILFLIYATMLTVLFLLVPSPRHESDLPANAVLVGDGSTQARPQLATSHQSRKTMASDHRMGALGARPSSR